MHVFPNLFYRSFDDICSHFFMFAYLPEKSAVVGCGGKYANAMGRLIDVTTDTVINDDSDTLLYIQKLGRTGSFWMPG